MKPNNRQVRFQPQALVSVSALLLLLLVSKLETTVAFTVSSSWPSLAFSNTNHDLTPALLAVGGNNGGAMFGDDTQRDFLPFSSSSSSSVQRQETRKSKRFATGNDLKELRSDLEELRQNLSWLQQEQQQQEGDDDDIMKERVEILTKAIETAEQRDPDMAYRKALKEIIHAKASHLLSEEERSRRVHTWEKEATAARKYIARFQLEGLWVGNFGGTGEELINVTYSGDTLVATKVIGDTNVPRGHVSFTAELSPTNFTALSPLNITVSDDSDDKKNTVNKAFRKASSTTTQLLWRYSGKGQVLNNDNTKKITKSAARRNSGSSSNSKYVDGQLVMLSDEQFSFIWIPSVQYVLFARPTPEQTVRLLRDTIAREDELENMRNHVARCFDMDMTESLARFHAHQDFDEQPIRRISLTRELDLHDQAANKQAKDEASLTANHRLNFWQLSKWRECIDRVLGNTDKKQHP
ncbi:hypothetical protein ACA910_004131 [Epithemia clementina (nom. ined.)]